MGTVELTGLEMMQILALGAVSPMALTRSRTIEALVLKRSSRLIPGFRGTPAGMTTILDRKGEMLASVASEGRQRDGI
jgi:hypothetical protein